MQARGDWRRKMIVFTQWGESQLERMDSERTDSGEWVGKVEFCSDGACQAAA